MPLRILCDENVPRKVTTFLIKAGHEIQTVPPGERDENIAYQAQKEKRIILTFDSDFANILAYPPEDLWGVIFLKVEPPTVNRILRSLERIIEHFPDQADHQGKLIVGEPDRFRVWEE